ncbi:MAG: hypothetical protein COA47_08605 [Robiginitomaculum sp.]|nr:MAG: hypothetical protein COA47_08605 [Robiginitomaculum sp.]
MKIVGTTKSNADDLMARVYRLNSLTRNLIATAYPNGKATTVSFYAKSIGGPECLRISLEGPFSSQTEEFNINSSWKRYEISIQNKLAVKPLKVFCTLMSSVKLHADISVFFFQCEEGLYTSSPIPPDIQLPCFAKDGEKGETRDRDIVHIENDKHNGIISSHSATVIMVAEPGPKTCQIMEDQFLTFFSLWSSKHSTEISIGISGKHGAKFVLRVHENGTDQYIESNIIGSNSKYFVCVLFDRNAITVIIDGYVAIMTNIKNCEFDKTYLGCSVLRKNDSLNGSIKSIVTYDSPLIYHRILEIYGELFPEGIPYTYEYMYRYFQYALTTDSELATFNKCIDESSFSYFIRQLDFAIPEIFNQFPPGQSFKEEDVRDWVYALLRKPEDRIHREEYSKIGRTDLTLVYAPTESEKTDGRKYHIEFKIWGRRGYKHAPSQPLKYMSENESVGVFIMIDRRASANIDHFIAIVKNNDEYPCLSIKSVPILEANLRYFVSFHKDSRYRSLRMMINIFIPIKN